MTLDGVECQDRSFYGFFGDFWLRHTFQERIARKSLQIDWDSLRMKLSALNVVFASLHFAPCVEGILCMAGVKLGHPLQNTRIRSLIRQQPCKKVAPSGVCECIVPNVHCKDRRA